MSEPDEKQAGRGHALVYGAVIVLALVALGIAAFETWREGGDDPSRTAMQAPADEPVATMPPAPVAEPPASPEDERVPGDRPVRDVTPEGMHSGPVLPSREIPPLPEEPPVEEKREQRFFQTVVVDAGTLKAKGRTIRLAGIEAPGADATCEDDDGTAWPCGRAAKAALNLFLRGRAIDCEVMDEQEKTLTAACRTGKEDIAGWLVEQGWARAGDGPYRAEGQAAEEKRLGLYRAAWNRATAAN